MNLLIPALIVILYLKSGKISSEPEEISKSGLEKLQSPKAYHPPDPVEYPEDYCQDFDDSEEFDYVVVGSGPGGSTVSRRLAEDPNVKVLLIEAGGDPPESSDIPINAGMVDDDMKWNFHSVPGLGLCEVRGNKGCPIAPGKVLGGSSILNVMMYVRGNKFDYDTWAKLGCDGWSYKELLPYFKKHENYRVLPLVSDVEAKLRKGQKVASKKYHGTTGPLYNSPYVPDPKTSALRRSLKEAEIENGIKYNVDVNGADQMGVTDLGWLVDPLGYRNSIVKAYLLNIPDNLKVCKYSLAMKIELEKKKAVGVHFQHNGTTNYIAKAKREYIISAGALNTAPLLERSGIGRRDVLEKVGVPVLHELQGVGENYQNHLPNIRMYKVNFHSDAIQNPLSDNLNTLTTFLNTSDPESSVPDVQFIVEAHTQKVPASFAERDLTGKIFNEVINEGKAVLQILAIHLRQPNPGSIHITQASDPNISPAIITNQYSTQIEIDRILKATNLIRKIMESDSMKRYNPELIVIDPCKQYQKHSREEILCQGKNLVYSLYHDAGVTSMGPKDNPNSVVDPELRVIGLENVRIVDSGIMPLVPRGNTEVPTVTLAEKAADMIKRAWN